MEVFLQAQGNTIWQKVESPYEVPTVITNINTSDVEANAKARNILLQGLSRNEFVRIKNIKSANKIWTTLADYHEG